MSLLTENLEKELQETRQRLQEAESTLHAIQHGQVDAFVVSHPQGEEVLTLKGAELLSEVLFENSQEYLILCDEKGRILRASRSAHAWCGRNPELQDFDAMFPMEISGRRFTIRQILAGNSLCAVEASSNLSKDSLFLLTATWVKDLGKGQSGALINIMDITERELAKQRAEISGEDLDLILKHTPNGLVVRDDSGRIVYINNLAAQYAGLAAPGEASDAESMLREIELRNSEGALLPKEQFFGSPPDEGESNSENILKCTHLQTSREYWLKVSTSILVRKKGRGSYRITSYIDVTRAHIFEQARLQSEMRLRHLVDSDIIGITFWLYDGTLTDANNAFLDLIGYSWDEFQIKRPTLKDITPEEWWEQDERKFAEIKNQGTCSPFEKEYITREGRRISVLVGGTSLPGTNGGIAYALDISAQKQAEETMRRSEERLRQAQKMEAVGQLAAGVAHEFNNLLTAINGYTNLLLMQIPEGDPAREFLKEIMTSGDRAADLTRQLLAYGRRQMMVLKKVNLNETVERLGTLISHTAGEKIQFRQNLEPRLDWIRADPGQIEQVIMNLVINARDAMPDGGELSITTENVFLAGENLEGSFSGLKEGPYVALSISDTGMGMDKETRERIFEPFFTTKGRAQASGLGLSMAFGIIEQSGGAIDVQSALGKGTTFRMYLPTTIAAFESITEKNTTSIALIRKQRETILVVEDEAVVRNLVCTVLQTGGYATLSASTGEEAIQRMEAVSGGVQLLLTDVVLPGIGGRILAEKARQIMPELPVLFMSGYSEDLPVLQGTDKKYVNFIEKPFVPGSLLKKVKEVLLAAYQET